MKRIIGMETLVTLLVVVLSAVFIGVLAKALRENEKRQSVVARITKDAGDRRS